MVLGWPITDDSTVRRKPECNGLMVLGWPITVNRLSEGNLNVMDTVGENVLFARSCILVTCLFHKSTHCAIITLGNTKHYPLDSPNVAFLILSIYFDPECLKHIGYLTFNENNYQKDDIVLLDWLIWCLTPTLAVFHIHLYVLHRTSYYVYMYCVTVY